MTKSTVYSGLCRGGPLDGKSRAVQDTRKFVPPGGGGFYVYAPAAGTPTPSGWRWIESKEAK